MRSLPVLAAAALLIAARATAHADSTTDSTTATVSARAPASHRHAGYVELLGKGGLWGVGYDYLLAPRIAFGATVSYVPSGDERVTTISPYAAIYPVGSARHRWFVQLGPQIVHLSRPSLVPEWSGMETTGIGAEVSSGYELRSRFLFRAFAMSTVGKGGVSPWLGVSVGFAL